MVTPSWPTNSLQPSVPLLFFFYSPFFFFSLFSSVNRRQPRWRNQSRVDKPGQTRRDLHIVSAMLHNGCERVSSGWTTAFVAMLWKRVPTPRGPRERQRLSNCLTDNPDRVDVYVCPLSLVSRSSNCRTTPDKPIYLAPPSLLPKCVSSSFPVLRNRISFVYRIFQRILPTYFCYFWRAS